MYIYSVCILFFKQKTAYEMRISDWSSDVCSSDLTARSRRASRLRSMRTDMGFFMRIGIVAPSTPILPDDAEAVRAVVSLGYPDVELQFDPQCFAVAGHFASEDAQRLAALGPMANRADIDALSLALGGYGASRIEESAVHAQDTGGGGKMFALKQPLEEH